MDRLDYTAHNAQTIDRWVEDGWEWGVPITHAAYEKAKAGDWSIVLTPTKPVPKDWFPPCFWAKLAEKEINGRG